MLALRTETMSVVAMSFSLCLPIFGLTTKFRADNWIDEKKRELLGNTRLLVTSEGQCFQMIQGEVKEVWELATIGHKEADARLVIHAKHAAANHPTVIVNRNSCTREVSETVVYLQIDVFRKTIKCNAAEVPLLMLFFFLLKSSTSPTWSVFIITGTVLRLQSPVNRLNLGYM